MVVLEITKGIYISRRAVQVFSETKTEIMLKEKHFNR